MLFIAVIAFAIMVHEFGHFITAKAFGMRVTEFFVGFGPRIWSTRRGETEYGVKGIPAGGYVKITGMTPYEEVDPAHDGALFYQQAPWKRFIVLVAGSATHFVLAVLLLLGAFWFIGDPVATNVIAAVSEDSPAAAAELAAGDRIVAVDGTSTGSFDEVSALVREAPGEDVVLTVERGGETLEVPATLASAHPDDGEEIGFLGVAPEAENRGLGFTGAVDETFTGNRSIWRVTGQTVSGLTQVFSPTGLADFFASVDDDGPRDENSITSLVGAAQITNELGQQGELLVVFGVLAQLNIVLGLLNMLPLPPLDGGHVAIMLVEETVNGVRRLRAPKDAPRRPRFHLNPNVVTPIALLVLAFFIVLSGTALYLDITSPASEIIQ
ncbi:RIP metalloprotease [Euzebya sp.]|uniref:M50 family metallopeptidase n=1 Tax=Euzebya sp. TaxID=1971409 RepID=UPI00351817F6